ncbi:hypothetical protein Pan216_41410 [Planctomycetes bacterium Pan216]|uniref:Uncharacterized protein n=1 Tax=Kolteria novifilia TaxID=2527975 RepID=A0A518B8I5_9BACT|nr:hypothetical protein Pan216_41410 [Planctomycetes bacterium Pan216]
MKRIICALGSTLCLIGCQSPFGTGSAQKYSDYGYGAYSAEKKASSSSRHGVAVPVGQQAKSEPMDDPAVQQAGYNAGAGFRRNNSFGHQKVAKALPSQGGQLPGGMPMQFAGGPGAGPMGPGAGMMGAPGMMGGGMPPGMMGGMPGMGGGMPPGMGPGCPPGGPGMGGPGMGAPGNLGPRFVIGRSQVRFVNPKGMMIGWQEAPGQFTPPQLIAPARYNFMQAQIYRLKLTNIPGRTNLKLYPTLEIYPGNMKINAFLAHNAIPIEFSDDDLDQVQAGNFVTKVIYLPDPKFQELAMAGVETLVSTRLDPGVDPIQEAHKRGAILAVIRLGGVDLEMQHSPSLFRAGPMATGVMPGDGSFNGMQEIQGDCTDCAPGTQKGASKNVSLAVAKRQGVKDSAGPNFPTDGNVTGSPAAPAPTTKGRAKIASGSPKLVK